MAIGVLGLSLDDYYAMTMGNFIRRVKGWLKNTWITQREVIAAIATTMGGQRVTGEEIFPFGISVKPEPPSPEVREMMRIRHEHTMNLIHGRHKEN